ncbi:MAG: ATP-binding protein [Pseudomonadota bacterium]
MTEPSNAREAGRNRLPQIIGVLVVIAASLIGAIVVGYVVAGNMIMERVSGLPVSLPLIFGTLAAAGFIFAILVIDRLIDLFRTQQQRLSGAKMHRRLAVILSVVALLPAAVAFSLTGALLNALTDEFFVERMETNASVARNLANAYADSVGRQMGFNLVLVERELSRARLGGVSPETAPIGYRRFLTGLASIYEFSELTEIDQNGRVVARISMSGLDAPALPPAGQLATSGSDGFARAKFGAVDPNTLDTYFVVIPLDGGARGALIGYRRENPRIADELAAITTLRNENRVLTARAQELNAVANSGFLLLSIVLLLAAAWIGLLVANAIVGPVRRLASAAGKVSSGDLESRVEVRRNDGELGDLGHAFNEMTEQLSAQRDELVAANEDAEDRRRFIETMLGVIPAGVVSVSRKGEIGLANPSAAAILGEEPADLVGRPMADVIPAMGRLLDIAGSTGNGMRESLEWSRSDNVRSLIVEISPEIEHGVGAVGFVVTLEDITELVTAQRTAAWADVARRIAHEIKNPLTPIQLSAERLRRRYAKGLEGRDREVFDQCTETIIRHVGDIGRMVTEFSSFARMPEPIMAESDLCEITREALFPFPVANPDITFVSDLPDHPVLVLCDGRLIVQALANMIKNAVEAISEDGDRQDGSIEIEITSERTGARVEVRDNGRGLPKKLQHRLTEPYMTTREKGTGLGLAIVRKAIEDHDGSFDIRDREGGGAIASLFLPSLQKAADPVDRDISATASPGEPALHGH